MMTELSPQEVKSDMLTAKSKVREILRALYLCGPDYIMLRVGRSERLVHKEQLVALLELGRSAATIEDIMSAALNEPMSARTQMEDVPPDTLLLVFSGRSGGQAGELSRTTFGEYRERGIQEAASATPDWWGAPLPLLYLDGDRVSLNEAGSRVMPCDAKELAKHAMGMERDRAVTIGGGKRARTFSLQPLGESVYLIEDITGDREMAEDLLWWAAVGKAFFGRLEENGAVIRRLTPFDPIPDGAADVIPCSWDGELVGRLHIGVPGDSSQQADEPGSSPEGEKNTALHAVGDEPPLGILDGSHPDEPKLGEIDVAEPAKRARGGEKSKPSSSSKPKGRRGKAEKTSSAANAKGTASRAGRKRAEKTAGPEMAPVPESPQLTPVKDIPREKPKKSGKPKPEAEPQWHEPAAVTEEDIVVEENIMLLELGEPSDAGNLARLNKNAARKAYGGASVRRETSGSGIKSKG